jgi:hypothetical protein
LLETAAQRSLSPELEACAGGTVVNGDADVRDASKILERAFAALIEVLRKTTLGCSFAKWTRNNLNISNS